MPPTPDAIQPAAASLSTGQARVLERIAAGAPLGEVLNHLARVIQEQSAPGALCSVMLLDDSGEFLRIGAAPDMPEGYEGLAQGCPIGPQAGLCGTAVFRRAPVVSPDISVDDLWPVSWRETALGLGLRSGWSAPIISGRNEVLGTFALYYGEPRDPQPGDLESIQVAAHLASVAIERDRAAGALLLGKKAEEDLRLSEQFYRTLIETTSTGYVVSDAAGFVTDANAEYARLTGRADVSEVCGHNVLEWTASHDLERSNAALSRCVEQGAMRNLEVDYVDSEGRITPVEISATCLETPEGPRLLAICHDVSDIRETRLALQTAQEALETRVRERTAELAQANAQIRARAHYQEAVAAFGQQALTGVEISALIQEGAELVGKTLGVEFVCVLEQSEQKAPEGPTQALNLIMRGGFGLPREWQGQTVFTNHQHSLAGYALHIREPVVIRDLAADPRFHPPSELVELGMSSGVTIVIPGEERPFGIMGAHTRRHRVFTPDDVHFLQSMANVLAEAIERRRAEDVIRAAQREAVRANAAKSDFLSRMSHELRTPLNAILGFGQLLEIDDLSDKQSESVEQIIRAGRHLLSLVNEVLDISRIESGHLSLSPEPVAINDLLREAMDLIRPLAGARRIELILLPELERVHSHVLADYQRLRQAVLNLLSNAVKYNRVGGRVTISGGLNLGADRMRVEIADTGHGIAPEDLPRLFTPFERLGAEESDVEGSGIGLALSKRLIEAQRGALGVESVVGMGSTFWMELPLAAEPTSDLLPMDLIEGLIEPDKTSDKTATRTVLHIEDNESNRLLVELLMAQRPAVQLLSAACGQEGLALACARRPDLILLDMQLPDTTGEEVLGQLRADERTRMTPVVVISAAAAAARVRQLRAAGAADYLTKPFNVGQFLRVLDQHLVAHAMP